MRESCTSILLTSVFRASNGLISSWMSSIAPLLIELHVLSLRVLTRPPPWRCVSCCICVSNIWYCITCTVLCYILSGCICVSNIWYCITCTVLCYILSGCICVSNIWYCITCTVLCYILSGCICVSNIWYCITCTVLCYILSGCICVSNIWYCITCTVLCYILFLHLSTNCSTYFYGDVLNASLVLLRSRLPGILMKLIQVWSVFFVLVGAQTR